MIRKKRTLILYIFLSLAALIILLTLCAVIPDQLSSPRKPSDPYLNNNKLIGEIKKTKISTNAQLPHNSSMENDDISSDSKISGTMVTKIITEKSDDMDTTMILSIFCNLIEDNFYIKNTDLGTEKSKHVTRFNELAKFWAVDIIKTFFLTPNISKENAYKIWYNNAIKYQEISDICYTLNNKEASEKLNELISFSQNTYIQMALEYDDYINAGGMYEQLGNREMAIYYFSHSGMEGRIILAEISIEGKISDILKPLYQHYARINLSEEKR